MQKSALYMASMMNVAYTFLNKDSGFLAIIGLGHFRNLQQKSANGVKLKKRYY